MTANRAVAEADVETEEDPLDGARAEVLGGGARADGSTAWMLFMEIDTVYAVELNATSGAALRNVPITGFHNFGEMTRVFMFDQSRELFYVWNDTTHTLAQRTVHTLFGISPPG
jgi:hypothetical protein